MKLMNEIIENNAGLLTSLLIYKGFNFEQAARFLPLALRAAMVAMSSDDAASVRSAGNPVSVATVMSKIDINVLAAKVAIEPELANSGVSVLMPKLLELLSSTMQGEMIV